MDLKLLFSGKLSSEEVASAFLATLLNHQPAARRAFFDVLAEAAEPTWPGAVEKLCCKEWKARTEVDQIDIVLDATDGSAQLIIENKLLAASKQRDQLLRYYSRAVKHKSMEGVTLGAIYLAPEGNVGAGEVESVLNSAPFQGRDRDFACQISWPDLAEAFDGIRDVPETDWFLTSGLQEIRRVILKGITTKWPPEGERRIILDLMSKVRESLQEAFPELRLGKPWPSRESYLIATARTNMTMWLGVKFPASDKKPYPPINLKDDQDRLRLTITARLKISGQGRKVAELKQR